MDLFSIFTGLFMGPLSRVLDSVDKRTEATTDRERIKAEIIKAHYETRARFMQAGELIGHN